MQASTDIEDPFHDDPNELPLPQIQYRFNERLLAIAHTNRPVAFSDIATKKSPGHKTQFEGPMRVPLYLCYSSSDPNSGCHLHFGK
jgi:hypothetical protein